MKRRRFASLLVVGAFGTAGCVETDTQPESVPIWVENLTEQARTVSVECIANGSDETLVSTEVELDPEDEQSFYADPIAGDGEYLVSIGVGEYSEETTVSGSGLREVDVEILAAERVRITPVAT
jgi:hypothetical protein